MSGSIIGTRNGLTRFAPPLVQHADLLLQGDDAAYAAGDDDRHPLLVVGVHLQAGLFDGLERGGGGELYEAVHAPRLLPVDVRRGVEVGDLARDGGLQAVGVERGYGVDAGLAGEQVLPGLVAGQGPPG